MVKDVTNVTHLTDLLHNRTESRVSWKLLSETTSFNELFGASLSQPMVL